MDDVQTLHLIMLQYVNVTGLSMFEEDCRAKWQAARDEQEKNGLSVTSHKKWEFPKRFPE
jgi:hypothetical protein